MSKRKSTTTQDINAPKSKRSRKGIVQFSVVPSLEHLANVKIATTIWSLEENHKLINSCLQSAREKPPYPSNYDYYPSNNQTWKIINDKIVEKILLLHLPVSCIKKLTRYVEAVGAELFEWIHYQDQNIFQFFDKFQLKAYKFFHHIVWTDRGTVDYENTAVRFINDETLSEQEKCVTACVYCLENEMSKFSLLAANETFMRRVSSYRMPEMVFYWMRCSRAKNRTFHPFDAYISLVQLNSSMVKIIGRSDHFWNTCSPLTKNYRISAWLRCPNPDVQLAMRLHLDISWPILHRSLGQILANFLNNFLWEDYFLPTMYFYREKIGNMQFQYAIVALAERIRTCQDDEMYYKYMFIFEEISSFMPDKLKAVTRQNVMKNILTALRWDKHFQIVKLLLVDKDSAYKEHLVLSPHGMQICMQLLERNQYHYFKSFVDLCLRKETFSQFKQQLANFIYWKFSNVIVSHIKNNLIGQLDEFLNWLFESKDALKLFKCDVFAKTVKSIAEYAMFNSTSCPRIVPEIEVLENFLMWHFDSNTDQVADYKLVLAKNSLFKMINTKVMRDAPDAVRKLMKWLLDDNQVKKEEFKVERKRCRILKFL